MCRSWYFSSSSYWPYLFILATECLSIHSDVLDVLLIGPRCVCEEGIFFLRSRPFARPCLTDVCRGRASETSGEWGPKVMVSGHGGRAAAVLDSIKGPVPCFCSFPLSLSLRWILFLRSVCVEYSRAEAHFFPNSTYCLHIDLCSTCGLSRSFWWDFWCKFGSVWLEQRTKTVAKFSIMT